MFYQLGTILCSSHVITHLILETALLDKYYYHPQFFLQMRKRRYWEVKSLAQGHTIATWQRQDSKVDRLAAKPMPPPRPWARKMWLQTPHFSTQVLWVWRLTSESQCPYLSNADNGTCLMPVASKWHNFERRAKHLKDLINANFPSVSVGHPLNWNLSLGKQKSSYPQRGRRVSSEGRAAISSVFTLQPLPPSPLTSEIGRISSLTQFISGLHPMEETQESVAVNSATFVPQPKNKQRKQAPASSEVHLLYSKQMNSLCLH